MGDERVVARRLDEQAIEWRARADRFDAELDAASFHLMAGWMGAGAYRVIASLAETRFDFCRVLVNHARDLEDERAAWLRRRVSVSETSRRREGAG